MGDPIFRIDQRLDEIGMDKLNCVQGDVVAAAVVPEFPYPRIIMNDDQASYGTKRGGLVIEGEI